MTDQSFSSYVSPLSWRYGSSQMRRIFSEEYKFLLWRKLWVGLAEAEHEAGLVSKRELNDLKENEKIIDVKRIREIEKDTHHDVVAALKEFAEKATIGGGKIHLGATSMDIVDNADMLRQKEALVLIKQKVEACLKGFVSIAERYAALPCMGYTHLQPAEPTTLGYRFAFYTQELLMDLDLMKFIGDSLLFAKGMKGAVGTSASFSRLLQGKKMSPGMLEKIIMKKLGTDIFFITHQTYPRKADYLLLTLIASIAESLHKFAFDLRLMQSPQIGEWMEPFASQQVGSSAMPFKRNPVNAEKICSLARFVAQLPRIAWDNASFSLLERTLDDSANKRIVMPEAFLAIDEMLISTLHIIRGMSFNEKKIQLNLEKFGSFAATEGILMEVVKKGEDRQLVHEKLRKISLECWNDIQDGKQNPMKERIKEDPFFSRYLTSAILEDCFEMAHYLGDAVIRTRTLVKKTRQTLEMS